MPWWNFYQPQSAWSIDQVSTKRSSAIYNFVFTVTKFCVMWEGEALPHNTKLRIYSGKIVKMRVHHWSMNQADHAVYAPNQWEMALQCNAVSHWLGSCTEWSVFDKSRAWGVTRHISFSSTYQSTYQCHNWSKLVFLIIMIVMLAHSFENVICEIVASVW